MQGANNCVECANAEDNGFCVAECPSHKYEDSNSECQPCDDQCEHSCYGAVSTSSKQKNTSLKQVFACLARCIGFVLQVALCTLTYREQTNALLALTSKIMASVWLLVRETNIGTATMSASHVTNSVSTDATPR